MNKIKIEKENDREIKVRFPYYNPLDQILQGGKS